MDIKKCKVEKNCEWSAAVVKGLAVTLGMSALVSLEGCVGNAAKTSNDLVEPILPSSSSELSSSSMSDSISSSSSNDSDNVNEMTPEELEEWLSKRRPVGGIVDVQHHCEDCLEDLDEL